MRIIAPLISLLLFSLALTVATPVRTSISFELHDEYTLRLQDEEFHNLSQVAFDVSDAGTRHPLGTATLQALPTTVYRPRDRGAFQHARLRSLRSQENEPIEWEEVELLAPDVQDKHTLTQLARMTGNAYALPGRPNWYEVDPAWNTVRVYSSHPAKSLRYTRVRKVERRLKYDSWRGCTVELPLRLGRQGGRISRACIPLARQFHGRAFDQGHNSPGPDVEEGQVQRQPAVLMLLCARGYHLDIPPGVPLLFGQMAVR